MTLDSELQRQLLLAMIDRAVIITVAEEALRAAVMAAEIRPDPRQFSTPAEVADRMNNDNG